MDNVTLHYTLCTGNSLRKALQLAFDMENVTGLKPDSISYTDGTVILGIPQTDETTFDPLVARALLDGSISEEQYLDLCPPPPTAPFRNLR